MYQIKTKPRKSDPTPSEVLIAIKEIADYVNQGWSIIYSTKLVCGGMNNKKAKAIREHDLYINVLNDYMSKTYDNKVVYHRTMAGSIECKKKTDI